MCRYMYGKDRCAHPRNFTIECIGEDSCKFLTDQEVADMDGMIMGDDTNTEDEDKCPNTKCGIYCEKYNRFYCAGEDNCQTEKDYLKHMDMHGYTI